MEPHQSEKTTGSVATKIQTQKAALWRRRSETIFLQGGHGLDGLFRWPGTRPAPREVSARSGDSTHRGQRLCTRVSGTLFWGHVALPRSQCRALGRGSQIWPRWNHVGAFKTPGAWAAPQSNELGISEVGFFTSVFFKKKRKETKTKLEADPRRSHGRRHPCCEHFLLYN